MKWYGWSRWSILVKMSNNLINSGVIWPQNDNFPQKTKIVSYPSQMFELSDEILSTIRLYTTKPIARKEFFLPTSSKARTFTTLRRRPSEAAAIRRRRGSTSKSSSRRLTEFIQIDASLSLQKTRNDDGIQWIRKRTNRIRWPNTSKKFSIELQTSIWWLQWSKQ